MIGLFIGLSASGLYDPSAFAIVGIGLAIISLYLVYDVQLVLGGKHRTQFGVDDYLAATTALFSDFLVVFVLLICAAGGAHE